MARGSSVGLVHCMHAWERGLYTVQKGESALDLARELNVELKVDANLKSRNFTQSANPHIPDLPLQKMANSHALLRDGNAQLGSSSAPSSSDDQRTNNADVSVLKNPNINAPTSGMSETGSLPNRIERHIRLTFIVMASVLMHFAPTL